MHVDYSRVIEQGHMYFTYEIWLGAVCRAYMVLNVEYVSCRDLVPHSSLHILYSHNHIMPRTRDEIIPNAIRGIQEVVVTHTKTKQGTVRSTEKIVPIVVPREEHLGRSSNSKKKKAHLRPQEEYNIAANVAGITDNAAGDPYMFDHDYPDPDPAVEESQARTTVCL